MVTAPMMHNSIKIDLPQGNQQEAKNKQEKKITVYIDQKAGISLSCTTHNNGKAKSIANKADLIREIQKLVGNDHNTTIYVEADKKVSYGSVYDLVDDIKFLGGVSHVVLAAEKRS
jgi:biopolymer transport protein ExbD